MTEGNVGSKGEEEKKGGKEETNLSKVKPVL